MLSLTFQRIAPEWLHEAPLPAGQVHPAVSTLTPPSVPSSRTSTQALYLSLTDWVGSTCKWHTLTYYKILFLGERRRRRKYSMPLAHSNASSTRSRLVAYFNLLHSRRHAAPQAASRLSSALFFYIEYVAIEPRVCICESVRMCVAALQPKEINRFWWKFLQIIWQIFARSIFLGFWHFEIDDVMAAILHLFSRALSQTQFCSYFLQNCRQGIKLSSAVCYLKSARSVGNFCQYGGPRLRKKIKMADMPK